MKYPRVYLLMCFLGLLLMTSSFMVNPVLPLFAEALGATGVLVGFVVSGYFVSRAFLELPSGVIGDKIGCRTPILIGLAVSMVSFLVCAISKDPYQLILGRMLGGFGSALFFCTSMTLVTGLFDQRTRGRALGIYQAIEFFGTFIGSLIGGFTASLVGYANTFYVCLILAVPTFVLAVLSPDLKKEAAPRTVAQSSYSVPYGALMNFTLVAVSIAAFLRLFEEQGVISTILPLYANRYLGMGVATIGILMGAKAAGYVIAVLVAGYMCDAIGRKRTLLIGIVLASAAVLLIGLSRSFESLMAFSALAGASSGIVMVPLPALVAESVPSSLRGTAMGAFRTLFDVGAIVGPISLMMVLDLAGPSACFYVAAAAILAGALPVAFIHEKSA